MSSLIYTVDLEDWYHGIPIPIESWTARKKRVEIGVNHILNCLDQHSQQATFFVLGDAAKKHPELIKSVSNAGHEIACHGQNHQLVYEQTPTQFREDVSHSKSILEDITQQPIKGYRAPYFSVTKKSTWALEILNELGFEYDSSISPVKTWRYGIEGAPTKPYLESKTGLIEIPISTVQVFSKTVNFGGAFFRILPFHVFEKFLKDKNEDSPGIFYIHPWEYDPHHPFARFKWKAMITHYWNLYSTLPKTQKLLQSVKTQTMAEYAMKLKSRDNLQDFSILQ